MTLIKEGMTVLAIDPATQLGWAYGTKGPKGWSVKSGSISFHNAQWDGAGMKFLKFRKFLNTFEPDIVAYEAVEAHSSTYAAHCYGGWVAMIQMYCEMNDAQYIGIPVGTIKKFWTGNGHAKKNQMIDKAVAMGYNPKDDNEADALAILHCCDSLIG